MAGTGSVTVTGSTSGRDRSSAGSAATESAVDGGIGGDVDGEQVDRGSGQRAGNRPAHRVAGQAAGQPARPRRGTAHRSPRERIGGQRQGDPDRRGYGPVVRAEEKTAECRPESMITVLRYSPWGRRRSAGRKDDLLAEWSVSRTAHVSAITRLAAVDRNRIDPHRVAGGRHAVDRGVGVPATVQRTTTLSPAVNISS